MKYIRLYEDHTYGIPGYALGEDLTYEVWEVLDLDNDTVSGYSLWLTKDEIICLVNKELIYFEDGNNPMYSQPYFKESNRNELKKELNFLRSVKGHS